MGQFEFRQAGSTAAARNRLCRRDEVASEPASRYTVYALDRRGHGDSHKPAAERYHFQDFAEDQCRVIEALALSDIFGIGHAAGATDLLRAAKFLPGRFSRLFVMEPTIMDPRAVRTEVTGMSDFAIGAGRAAPPGRVR
jgi:pimeloyl-ACP methyl ester carboxylesterase